jgi:hypothetical protein
MNTLNASVPQHIYGHVKKEILYGLNDEGGTEPCVITGVTSIPSRALHFSILCESGAQWARIPIHFLYHNKPGNEYHPLEDLQMWDCMGWEFSVCQYSYFREMSCTFRNRSGKEIPARYWFTLDHTENGYSLSPVQHKCYHLLLLEDGSSQIAAMPNNRIRWFDPSFANSKSPLPAYKVMANLTWHCESPRLLNPQDTAITQDA